MLNGKCPNGKCLDFCLGSNCHITVDRSDYSLGMLPWGFRMVTVDIWEPLVPAASVIEVLDHHYEVGLSMPINFTYNMSL